MNLFCVCQCYSSHDFFSLLLTESRGFLYNVFCAGGIDKENPLNPKDNRENGMMVFFRDRFGPILNNKWTKALVILLFLGYLAISTMGVTQLKEGLERRKLSRYDSYSVEYYETDDLYFREYPYRVNVSQSLNFFCTQIYYLPSFLHIQNCKLILTFLTLISRLS